jgi:hypothetical protein
LVFEIEIRWNTVSQVWDDSPYTNHHGEFILRRLSHFPERFNEEIDDLTNKHWFLKTKIGSEPTRMGWTTSNMGINKKPMAYPLKTASFCPQLVAIWIKSVPAIWYWTTHIVVQCQHLLAM